MTYIDEVAFRIRAALCNDERPDQQANELYRLYALLVLVKGEDVTLENIHDAWSVWMLSQDPDHASLRPFAELDHKTREEDRPYLDAVRAVSRQNTTGVDS